MNRHVRSEQLGRARGHSDDERQEPKPSKSGEGWAGFTWDNDRVVPNVFASC